MEKHELKNGKEVQFNEITERNSYNVSWNINKSIYPKIDQDKTCISQLSLSKNDLISDGLKRVLLKIRNEKRVNKRFVRLFNDQTMIRVFLRIIFK